MQNLNVTCVYTHTMYTYGIWGFSKNEGLAYGSLRYKD